MPVTRPRPRKKILTTRGAKPVKRNRVSQQNKVPRYPKKLRSKLTGLATPFHIDTRRRPQGVLSLSRVPSRSLRGKTKRQQCITNVDTVDNKPANYKPIFRRKFGVRDFGSSIRALTNENDPLKGDVRYAGSAGPKLSTPDNPASASVWTTLSDSEVASREGSTPTGDDNLDAHEWSGIHLAGGISESLDEDTESLVERDEDMPDFTDDKGSAGEGESEMDSEGRDAKGEDSNCEEDSDMEGKGYSSEEDGDTKSEDEDSDTEGKDNVSEEDSDAAGKDRSSEEDSGTEGDDHQEKSDGEDITMGGSSDPGDSDPSGGTSPENGNTEASSIEDSGEMFDLFEGNSAAGDDETETARPSSSVPSRENFSRNLKTLLSSLVRDINHVQKQPQDRMIFGEFPYMEGPCGCSAAGRVASYPVPMLLVLVPPQTSKWFCLDRMIFALGPFWLGSVAHRWMQNGLKWAPVAKYCQTTGDIWSNFAERQHGASWIGQSLHMGGIPLDQDRWRSDQILLNISTVQAGSDNLSWCKLDQTIFTHGWIPLDQDSWIRQSLHMGGFLLIRTVQAGSDNLYTWVDSLDQDRHMGGFLLIRTAWCKLDQTIFHGASWIGQSLHMGGFLLIRTAWCKLDRTIFTHEWIPLDQDRHMGGFLLIRTVSKSKLQQPSSINPFEIGRHIIEFCCTSKFFLLSPEEVQAHHLPTIFVHFLATTVHTQLECKFLDHFPDNLYDTEAIYGATLYALAWQRAASLIEPLHEVLTLFTSLLASLELLQSPLTTVHAFHFPTES
ncbi:hypothetical protein EDB86DRAFT_2839281 [Lactarius hatsudake]|nr:hypothetical protein EDB86DRAFT_2839281 [Lactarius hatsudake]